MISPPQSLHLQIRRPRTQTHLGSCQAVFANHPERGELNQRPGFSVPFWQVLRKIFIFAQQPDGSQHRSERGGGEERGQDERSQRKLRGWGCGGGASEETMRQTDTAEKRLEQQGSLSSGDQAQNPASRSLQKQMNSENTKSQPQKVQGSL